MSMYMEHQINTLLYPYVYDCIFTYHFHQLLGHEYYR